MKDLLADKNTSSPLLRGLKAVKILEKAESWLTAEFGPDVLGIVKPAYFKNNVLTLACLSTTAAQEIRLRERQLLDHLNTGENGFQVKSIKYLS